MTSKPMRIARHVYLRTQQRRLRHVKGVFIRNLTCPMSSSVDPLHISVYFTIHLIHAPNIVLFKSDTRKESYNPSWESVAISPRLLGQRAAVPSFLLRVWVRERSGEEEGEGEECSLAFEKIVELFDLSHLGSMINRDGSGYPPNSVVVNMYEGYYSNPEVGGVPCPPKIVHSLSDYLPPQSLVEVQKKEVVDSYHHPELRRLLSQQEVLNRTRLAVAGERGRVETCRQVESDFFEKRTEKERILSRLKLLRTQLDDVTEPEEEERKELDQLQKSINEKELDLHSRQKHLDAKWVKLKNDSENFSKRKELMIGQRNSKKLRQHCMIYDLYRAFPIQEREGVCTICNVLLPNADQLDQPSRVEQLGVALGFVAHLLYHLSKALLIPLLYPIRPQGSKSTICDLISDETLIDNIKEFPLYAKGSEKALFQYAVFLLNKDISQVRQHCGYGTSRSMFKKTLPNLKFLLDRLTREILTVLNGEQTGVQLPIAMDTVSMTASYVSVDASSVASGSNPGSFKSPGLDDFQHISSPPLHSDSSPQASTHSALHTSNHRFTLETNNPYTSSSTPPVQTNRRQQKRQLLFADNSNFTNFSDSSQEADIDQSLEEMGEEVLMEREEEEEEEDRRREEEEDGGRENRYGVQNGRGEVRYGRREQGRFEEREEEEGEREDLDSRLTKEATDHRFGLRPTKPACRVTDRRDHHSLLFSGMGRNWSADNEPSEDGNGTAGASPSSLSKTPIVKGGPMYPLFEGPSCDLLEESTDEMEARTLKQSEVSAFAHQGTSGGSLEETLKIAMHATQALLGHSPPEFIEMESTLPPSGAEANIEATQALLNMAPFSFTESVLSTDAVNHSNSSPKSFGDTPPPSEALEEAVPHDGPTLIPDSIELPILRTTRSQHNTPNEGEHSDEHYGFRKSSQGGHAVPFRSYAMESGYVKAGMATPHMVSTVPRTPPEGDGRGRRRDFGIQRGFAEDDEEEQPQSLDDFIDGPLERVRPRMPWQQPSGKQSSGRRREWS